MFGCLFVCFFVLFCFVFSIYIYMLFVPRVYRIINTNGLRISGSQPACIAEKFQEACHRKGTGLRDPLRVPSRDSDFFAAPTSSARTDLRNNNRSFLVHRQQQKFIIKPLRIKRTDILISLQLYIRFLGYTLEVRKKISLCHTDVTFTIFSHCSAPGIILFPSSFQ